MRSLHCHLVFAFIIFIMSIFLVGCAIGVRPRSYEVSPEDNVYSEGTVYDSYYDTASRPSTYHYYYSDPSYDPWTMGTYYQQYSGPPRAYGSSESSSTSSAQSESKRPAVKGRDSISTSQSKAPSNEGPSLKRDRTSIRDNAKPSSGSNEPAITSQKVRKSVKREREPVSKEPRSDNNSQGKQRRVQVQTTPSQENSSDSEKDEEKEKKPED